MKLELKHLAAYLPYGLKFRISEGKIFNLNANHIFNNHTGNYKGLDKGAKIILRPLSDLTKEIEVGGERFVPIEKLCDLYSPKFHNSYQNDKCAGFVYGFAAHDVLNLKNIFENKYWQVEKLFEWHFDVFGLIPAGLAIDINTLNK